MTLHDDPQVLPSRRRALAWMALPACAAVAGLPARAAAFPDKPVRLIVPFPPGGGTDILARPLAQKLSERWKQTVIVDNRAGAGGSVGSEAGAQAPADGHTLVLGTVGTHAINQSLYPKLAFDAVRDTVAITIVANTPNVMVLHPSVQAASVAEFIALCKAQPGRVNYASPGNGTPPHLAAEVFKNMAGVSVTHVPYRGSGPALTDLLSGQVQMMIANAPVVLPHIKEGRLRALATTSARRPATLRDVPTLAETLPGYEADTWYGLFVPAATPADRVARLHEDVAWALALPEIADLYAAQGAEVVADSVESANRKMRADVVKWRDVIRDNHVQVD